jgi:hypothetical protein
VKYYYDKAALAGMKQELSTIVWEEKLSIQDENKQWTIFKDTVLCMGGERYKEYCKQRNKMKSLTRKAVKDKETEIAKDVKNNPKKFWQYTKSKTKPRIGISDLIMNKENGVETLTK